MSKTICIDNELLEELEKLAAETGRKLTDVIEDALWHFLVCQASSRREGTVELTTCGGRGLQPGVVLDSPSSLLDLMEEARDLP